MDTSELVYKKIILSGNNSDTVDISKAEFKSYAKQFLDLPDIAAPNKADDYDNADDFDETLNNVLLMYTAKKPEDEVRSQTILMQPDELGNTHVKTILVNSANDSNEVSIEKNMTWHINKRFQIITKENRANQPEKISTIIISWE